MSRASPVFMRICPSLTPGGRRAASESSARWLSAMIESIIVLVTATPSSGTPSAGMPITLTRCTVASSFVASSHA
jgi:hypothetical protein